MEDDESSLKECRARKENETWEHGEKLLSGFNSAWGEGADVIIMRLIFNDHVIRFNIQVMYFHIIILSISNIIRLLICNMNSLIKVTDKFIGTRVPKI